MKKYFKDKDLVDAIFLTAIAITSPLSYIALLVVVLIEVFRYLLRITRIKDFLFLIKKRKFSENQVKRIEEFVKMKESFNTNFWDKIVNRAILKKVNANKLQ